MATISEPNLNEQITSAQSGSSWVPANPAPLGLMAFGLTTLILSVMNANLVSFDKSLVTVLGPALAYGGIGQLLAGMWEFRTGNTFGAVAFSSFGAFWISFYFLVQQDAATLAKTGGFASGVGLYLWAWGIFTGMMFLCTFASPRAIQAIFLLLTITFILLGIGNSGTDNSIIHAGGWCGLATAAVAMYTATGEIMAQVYGHDVLPLGRPAPRR
jgi:succinate-acetate transporter protein